MANGPSVTTTRWWAESTWTPCCASGGAGRWYRRPATRDIPRTAARARRGTAGKVSRVSIIVLALGCKGDDDRGSQDTARRGPTRVTGSLQSWRARWRTSGSAGKLRPPLAMIRFTHLKGSLQGTTSSSDKRWLRIGTGHDCELRYDVAEEPRVAPYHAAVVLKEGVYHLIDLDAPGGVRVNGKKVSKVELRSGDKIRFGATGGPEAQVEIVIDSTYDAAQDAAEIQKVLQAGTRA